MTMQTPFQGQAGGLPNAYTLSDALVLSGRVKDLLFIADALAADPVVNVPGAMLSLIEVTLAEARKLDAVIDELMSPDAPPVHKEVDGDEQ